MQVTKVKINKYVWIGIAAVVVLVLYFTLKNTGNDSAMESPSPSPSATATPAKSSSGSSVKKSGDAATSPKTYTELLTEYEGRRIQFDINCQAVPNNLTFKNGTSIMLDNRSGDARTIFIGPSQYALPGYGYKIITLSSSEIPKDLLISCEGAVNVGRIFLQAKILQQ
ncbi:MAG: hypothetical protein Q8Q06_00435 [bacterium]|nr:hypothetical protein [bacterium]